MATYSTLYNNNNVIICRLRGNTKRLVHHWNNYQIHRMHLLTTYQTRKLITMLRDIKFTRLTWFTSIMSRREKRWSDCVHFVATKTHERIVLIHVAICYLVENRLGNTGTRCKTFWPSKFLAPIARKIVL